MKLWPEELSKLVQAKSGGRRILFNGTINMNRITETDQGIIRIIEVILEEEILEGIFSEIRIIEMDTEEIIEMIIMKEVEVGLGIDSIPIILEGVIEIIVGLDQVQELVPIEIELDAINVGNMISLLRIVQLLK